VIFFLASLLERLLNFLAPSRTVFPEHPLADMEADTEVFEPDELWAAIVRRRWEQHDVQFDPDCPECRELLEDPIPEEPLAEWEREIRDEWLKTQKESPRAAATAGGVDTEKGNEPMPDQQVINLQQLLNQVNDDEITQLRDENTALRNAIAKMESRPIPYRLVDGEVSE
jgi:hypothetical protein